MTTNSILRISESEPSPIVRDFELYSEFLINNRIPLTPKNTFHARTTLYQINQQMKTYVTADNPNYEQYAYPLLNLFYHLALVGRLFHKAQSKGGRFELQPTERYRMYQNLRPVEKYFFLLETLWIDVDWKDLNISDSRNNTVLNIGEFFSFICRQQPGQVFDINVANNEPLAAFVGCLGRHILYLSFFGFWSVTIDEAAMDMLYSKYDFRCATLTPSRFGIVMALVLAGVRNLPYWNVPSRREYGEIEVVPGSPLPESNTYQLILERRTGKKTKKAVKTDYIPEPFILPFKIFCAPGELEATLPRGLNMDAGTYTFKVSLNGRTWRRVELAAQHTLEDLHLIIQDAFELNNDHLYCFFMDGKRWSRNSINCKDDDHGPYVTEARIGKLGLEPGQEILYLFDYGDEWIFKVLLEEKAMERPMPLKPVIKASKGDSPDQYRRWDD